MVKWHCLSAKTYVLSYDLSSGTLCYDESIEELVHHKNYNLEEGIQEANSKYSNYNDENMYIQYGDWIVQRTLQGGYVRTLYLEGKLLYVNNKELIYQTWSAFSSDATEYLYSVPLEKIDGQEYPNLNKKRRITKVGDDKGECTFLDSLYADEKYLVFMCNYHNFRVYDRKQKKFIEIKEGFMSVNLAEGKDISVEQKLNQFIQENPETKDFSFFDIREGKCLFHYYKTDADGWIIPGTHQYYCYDLNTEKGYEIKETDDEYFYFLLR